MTDQRLLARALRFLFYVCLDVAAGAAICVISVGEAGLTPGQLVIRILTAMTLASAIAGGPDIMLYWQESGRRIAAEEERDDAAKRAAAAEQRVETERDARTAAEQERDAAVANAAALAQRLDELSAQVEQLRNDRTSRRSRRRHLRRNGQ